MLANDLMVAAIVTVMLIPQSLAYALLAGLPPQVGLYASMAPLVLYAIFGTSRTLAVGPVAVASLMTAAAATTVAAQGTPEYLGAAIALALISGLLLLAMGLLRLGFLANFLSHPVISGFITASGIQIAAGQLAPVLGHPRGRRESGGPPEVDRSPTSATPIPIRRRSASPRWPFSSGCGAASSPCCAASGSATGPRTSWRRRAPSWPSSRPPPPSRASGSPQHGVKIVGTVPKGLPKLTLPPLDAALWTKLLVPALLISIVGYVESISVALTLAAKRRQRVDPDQELIALGAVERRRGRLGRIPGHRRLRALGGELRGRRRDSRRRAPSRRSASRSPRCS